MSKWWWGIGCVIIIGSVLYYQYQKETKGLLDIDFI